MRHSLSVLFLACWAGGMPGFCLAQTRDELVLDDLAKFADSDHWIYSDLEAGIDKARQANKPLFVVFRCIPCEACQEFDEQVAARDPQVAKLLDQFVCVRIPKANDIDLSVFQFDFDQSWAAFMMNADQTIYGRYGTRSNRNDEARDISLPGLAKALAAALEIHRAYPANKSSLAGKQVSHARFHTPREYPNLKENYTAQIDYQEQPAKSCLHCHQIGDGERQVYRDSGKPIPDEVLFPYPNPRVLGLDMDPKEMATVASVADGSAGEESNFQPGDEISSLQGQPIISTADLQWVLHNAPATGALRAMISRNGKPIDMEIPLQTGWRQGDITWRTTTWGLRRMALGGLVVEPLSNEDPRRKEVGDRTMALNVKHVGQYGDHAVAKRAGFQVGDVLLAFDGRSDFATEAELLAYAVQNTRAGDLVAVNIWRDGGEKSMELRMQ